MLKETDEKFHQMELEEYFNGEVKGDLFAVSRIFAEARKQMNLPEYKAFTLALTSVRWKEACPEVLYIDKRELAKIVGVNSDSNHLSENLYRSIGDMPHHSYLKFTDKDKDLYVNGNFVRTIAFFKNKVRIKLEPDFLTLFGNLEKNYITMWSTDIYKMRSERSIKFYELLRENSDSRIDINQGTVGIKYLKELYGIPKEGKGSYVYKGHFKRPEFEQRVIDPVCSDLAHTAMIQLILQADGKYYEKVKRGGRVIAYKFYWTISMHPAVATAAEVAETNQNPEVLKIAKDIVSGSKKKKSKAAKKSTFNDYEHEYMDWDAAAQKIMQQEQAGKGKTR